MLADPVNNAAPGANIFSDYATIPFTATVTDSGGLSDTNSGNILIIDGEPTVVVNEDAVTQLIADESAGEIGTAGGSENAAGFDTITADFSLVFDSDTVAPGVQTNFGPDRAGTASYSLVLTGTGVPSGLFALNPSATTAGSEILLSQVGDVVTGSADGTNYFTISVDPATGVVTFTQLAAIWHPIPGTGSFDEPATLTLADPAALQIVQTITDFDGDKDSAGVNLGAGVFTIEDDGPTLDPAGTFDESLVLDESALDGTLPAYADQDGVYSATVDLSTVFGDGDL
ncbi:DUF5801 repeats-in-toxin domain-containing protein, partial [Aphanothece microscopica]|uniref:DUF5801 repeats-in-toxin domain-containing protein n=1 Tax=Aphanothece microscopica TaxID=1049561 RepID=UPI003CE4F400